MMPACCQCSKNAVLLVRKVTTVGTAILHCVISAQAEIGCCLQECLGDKVQVDVHQGTGVSGYAPNSEEVLSTSPLLLSMSIYMPIYVG